MSALFWKVWKEITVLFSFLSVTELSHCEKKILQILIAVFTITEEKSGNKTVRMWVAGGGGVQTCQNPKVVYQETTLIRGQNHIHSA